MAWGILMIVLGILVIVIEIPLAKKDSEQVWKRMSTNEQAFFTNDKEKLRKQRSLNSMYVGVFTIVKGVLFLGVSLGLFLLDRDLKQRMVWKTTSRLPEIESHEQVVFK